MSSFRRKVDIVLEKLGVGFHAELFCRKVDIVLEKLGVGFHAELF